MPGRGIIGFCGHLSVLGEGCRPAKLLTAKVFRAKLWLTAVGSICNAWNSFGFLRRSGGWRCARDGGAGLGWKQRLWPRPAGRVESAARDLHLQWQCDPQRPRLHPRFFPFAAFQFVSPLQLILPTQLRPLS